MAATPEVLKPQEQVTEQPLEFEVPEVFQQSGVQVVQKNFKAQVSDDKGAPIIQTPPTQVITVTPPASQTVLAGQAKGSISSSLTWFAAFWLRIIKKALHLGWRVSETQNG